MSPHLQAMLCRLVGNGAFNLLAVRREVRAALAPTGSVPDAPDLLDAVDPMQIPSSSTLGCTDRVLAEIDQDGFAFAVRAEDESYFNRRTNKRPRQAHQLSIVMYRGRVCVRKSYRPAPFGTTEWGEKPVAAWQQLKGQFWVRSGLNLLNEVATLLRLRHLPFVPKIRGLDLRAQVLVLDYVDGQSLRHHAASTGAPVHDADLLGESGITGMDSFSLDRREVALLERAEGGAFRDEVRQMARQVLAAGVAPLDIKLGNFLRGRRSSQLYWIDFETVRLDSQPHWSEGAALMTQTLENLLAPLNAEQQADPGGFRVESTQN